VQINGKTALVLGATRGIGRAIALSLAERGARLIVPTYDWPEDSARLRQDLTTLGGDHLILPADLRKPAQIADLFNQIQTDVGRLDILINNIERGGMPVVHGPYTPEQWDLEIDTTLKAKWWVVNSAMTLLKAAPEAVIISLSSIAASVGRSGPAAALFNDAYAAANRAVASFTETWAREGAPTVRVNELMLGFIEHRHAENTRGWGLLSASQREQIRGSCLLARTGRLAEVVAAVRFLITEATYMTGTVLRLDGGYTLGHAKVPPMPPGVLDD
jgi:3-oxoacyl-[acyl-carrier protein] reductase